MTCYLACTGYCVSTCTGSCGGCDLVCAGASGNPTPNPTPSSYQSTSSYIWVNGKELRDQSNYKYYTFSYEGTSRLIRKPYGSNYYLSQHYLTAEDRVYASGRPYNIYIGNDSYNDRMLSKLAVWDGLSNNWLTFSSSQRAQKKNVTNTPVVSSQGTGSESYRYYTAANGNGFYVNGTEGVYNYNEVNKYYQYGTVARLHALVAWYFNYWDSTSYNYDYYAYRHYAYGAATPYYEQIFSYNAPAGSKYKQFIDQDGPMYMQRHPLYLEDAQMEYTTSSTTTSSNYSYNNMKINSSNAWRIPNTMKINVGGTWKNVPPTY